MVPPVSEITPSAERLRAAVEKVLASREFRVRRLTDSSDDWVAVVTAGQEFVWIRPEPARH